MKSLRFVGTSREDLSEFPDKARTRAGFELFMVQVGREPNDWKPIPSVGPGAAEIRVRDDTGAFRVIYVARFAEAIYVLHAFQKKTRKTARSDLALAALRYSQVKAMAR
ncbi:MAG: type II toxin-antitoxin system RelE/ParE family toxin [Burkholderiales bacterium]